MTIFSFLFPTLALALWRANRTLEPNQRPVPTSTMPGNYNAAQAVAVLGGLLALAVQQRETIKELRAKLVLAADDKRELAEEDAAVEAKLDEVRATLDQWTAEDTPTPEPEPDPEPPTDPEPTPTPDPEPAPPEENPTP